MSQLPHLASLILGQPLMIEPAKFRAILAVIGPRLGIPGPAMPEVLRVVDQRLSIVSDPKMEASEYRRTESKGFGYRFEGGIAVIEIAGGLTNRARFDPDASTTFRSYESIRADVMAAAKAPDVKGILLRMDTPGGEVAGVFDLADFLAKVNREKAVWAVTDDAAFSAGYLIASQAKRVLVSQTGGLGSIGVIMTHVEFSEYLENEGIKVTTIFKGDHKDDFSPYKPLSKGARSEAEELVAKDYRMFVDAVARGRGISAESVAATQARLFFGEDAVSAKLATAVINFPSALAEMQKKVADGQKTFVFGAAETAAPSGAGSAGAVGNGGDRGPASLRAEGQAGAPTPLAAGSADAQPDAQTGLSVPQNSEPEASGNLHEEDTAMAEQVNKPEASSSPPVAAVRPPETSAADGYTTKVVKEIIGLCAIYGDKSKATAFMEKGMTVEQVQAALIDERAEKHEKEEPSVSSHGLATTGLRDHPRQVDSMRGYLKARGITPADEGRAN